MHGNRVGRQPLVPDSPPARAAPAASSRNRTPEIGDTDMLDLIVRAAAPLPDDPRCVGASVHAGTALSELNFFSFRSRTSGGLELPLFLFRESPTH